MPLRKVKNALIICYCIMESWTNFNQTISLTDALKRFLTTVIHKQRTKINGRHSSQRFPKDGS